MFSIGKPRVAMRAGRTTFLILMMGVVCAAAASTVHADPPQVAWRNSLADAIREAEELDRPILIRVTASWCTHCSRMEWRTFRDEKVATEIGERFVALEIDADANEALLESLNVKLLPTTLVISSDRRELARFTGFRSADDLSQDFTKIAASEPSRPKAPGLIEPALGREITADDSAPEFAFGGYCLVSMFETETLAPGVDEHALVHRGRTLRFASVEHLRRFEANPLKYWPALDGLCPVSALDERIRREGEPGLAIVYRGRLWLFADKEHEERFFTAAADYHRRLH